MPLSRHSLFLIFVLFLQVATLLRFASLFLFDCSRQAADKPAAAVSRVKRPGPHDEVEVYGIYSGKVTKVMDFGCFVQLDGFAEKKEGACCCVLAYADAPISLLLIFCSFFFKCLSLLFFFLLLPVPPLRKTAHFS